MKQTLLLLLFGFLAFNLSAQLEFGDESIEKTFEAPGAYDVENKLALTNPGQTDEEFIWHVETVYAPEEWNFFVCDLNKCYGPGTASITSDAMNTLVAGETEEMRFHLQPFETPGDGQYILNLTNINDDTDIKESLVLTFNGSDVVDVTNEELIDEINIFPNPVSDYFQLNNEAGLASTIEVYDILGKKIKSFNVQGSDSYFIGDVQTGRYFARIFDNGGQALKVVRIVKR